MGGAGGAGCVSATRSCRMAGRVYARGCAVSWAVVSPVSCVLVVTAAGCDERSVIGVLAMTVMDCLVMVTGSPGFGSAAVCSPSCDISLVVEIVVASACRYVVGSAAVCFPCVWATVSPVSGALAVTAADSPEQSTRERGGVRVVVNPVSGALAVTVAHSPEQSTRDRIGVAGSSSLSAVFVHRLHAGGAPSRARRIAFAPPPRLFFCWCPRPGPWDSAGEDDRSAVGGLVVCLRSW
eukprot:COSAG06_NODE_1203_length_10283_cov_11.228397_2_plen_237_part_00